MLRVLNFNSCLWAEIHQALLSLSQFSFLTQSKFQTITKSVHGKFNCITVKYNGTGQSIYIILEVHYKFIMQINFSSSITKQLQQFLYANSCLWAEIHQALLSLSQFSFLTQSKFQTITKSVHGKFNCITVKYNGTGQSIYIILEVHYKFIMQIHFSLSITKQLQQYTHFIQFKFSLTY